MQADLRMDPAPAFSTWSSILSKTSTQVLPLAPEEVLTLTLGGLGELLVAHLIESYERELGQLRVPEFWQILSAAHDPEADLEAVLLRALQVLSSCCTQQLGQLTEVCQHVLANAPGPSPPLVSLVLGAAQQLKRSLCALLLCSAPLSLSDLLQQYFSSKIDQLGQAMKGPKEEEGVEDRGYADQEDAVMEEGDGENLHDKESLARQTGASYLRPVAEALRQLGSEWQSRLHLVCQYLQLLDLQSACEEAYTAVVHRHVSDQIHQMARGVYDVEVLPRAKQYVQVVPLEFLKLVLAKQQGGTQPLQEWTLRLTYYLYQTLGEIRIREMFDILVDYPDSLPAIRDISQCLCHTNLHSTFVIQFRSAVCQRLLHAGASTGDIIHQYVSTIRALREIDPSGALLSAVSVPICQYLRGRHDAIRCIVSLLTQDSSEMNESLLNELEVVMEEPQTLMKEAEGDEEALKMLEGKGQGPQDGGRASGGAGGGDIVSLLINIYGSKELFIKEYQAMMCERLLAKSDYMCEREIRTLELLKLRFGEGSLHACEVMVKDLHDSKRTDQSIHTSARSLVSVDPRWATLESVSATVVSYLFWPDLREDEITLPRDVQWALEAYANRYHKLKSPRQIKWRPALGVVDLEVKVADTVLDFTVTPVHASLLMQFGDQPKWTASELSAALGIPQAVVRRKALFWVNNGVIVESRTGEDVVYIRAEVLDPARAGSREVTDLSWEEDTPNLVLSVEDKVLQEMAVYENYIMTMLTNFQSMGLERMHNMLRMFVLQPKYDKSQDQLASYLNLMVARDRIICQNGLYKKKPAVAT